MKVRLPTLIAAMICFFAAERGKAPFPAV